MGDSAEKDPVLTETHVIIIACVCAVIIVTLLIVLFCFICRRRRNAAKAQQAGNPGDPPPYQAVSPTNKKQPQHHQQQHHHHQQQQQQQGYDNQGMDMSDLALTQISHAPSAPPPESDRSGYHAAANNNNINNNIINNHQLQPPYGSNPTTSTTNNHQLQLAVHANLSFTNTSYGPLELYGGGATSNSPSHAYNNHNHGTTPAGESPVRQLSPRQLYLVDHHQFDNELNWRRENNRMDNYPNRDNMSPNPGSAPHSPTKDKYIDLQERGGMDANDQGYPSAEQGGGKPKKRVKWRWLWRKEKPMVSTPPAFSHEPPGHTCGLPCCQQDSEVQFNPVSTQRGCVMVPVVTPLELSESNFVMKRALRPSSLFGHSTSTPDFQGTTSDVRTSKSMQDLDTVSDDEYEEDPDGRRIIRFKHRRDVMAPEPSAELLAMHGVGIAEESATLMRRRKHLAPWEQIKRRQFTFPDSPQTPCSIMFLNHTPGESTDSFDNDNNLSGLTSLVHTLTRQHEKGPGPGGKSPIHENAETEADAVKEDGSSGSVFSMDPSLSELSTKAGVRRSIVETSLPPLPLDDTRSAMSVGEVIEDNDDDESDDGEHIYDVVRDVKAESEQFAKVEEEARLQQEQQRRQQQQQEQKEKEQQQRAYVSSSSEIEIAPSSDSASTVYQASVSDIDSLCTESYIYNGSLLSQCTDSSHDHSIYYPGSLLRQRCQMDIAKRPMIFMLGGKPVILPRMDEIRSDDQKFDSSSTSGQSLMSSHRSVPKLHVSSEKDSKCSSAYDSSHKGNNSTLDLNKASSLDLDSKFTTKLKLWDLRLININREENQYSTFPPRNPVSEDLCVGFFTRCPEFGYRHRHNSDVTTDNYVSHKIQRILRAPVITKSKALSTFAPGNDRLSLFDTMTSSQTKVDPLWENEQALERWKQALMLENRGKMFVEFDAVSTPDAQSGTSKDSASRRYSKKYSVSESESSMYEPVTLPRIFRMGEKRNPEDDSTSTLSVLTHRQHVDSLLVRKGSRKGGRSVSNCGGSLHSAVGVDGDASAGVGADGGAIYGGSLYGSTFGWDVVGRPDADRPVIWGDPSVVDWRHQAELFKETSLVTLIM